MLPDTHTTLPKRSLTAVLFTGVMQVVQGNMAFMSGLAGMQPPGKAMADPEAAHANLHTTYPVFLLHL
jgi:hypothetical protein